MNRFIWTFVVGALGGASATMLILCLLGVGGFATTVQSNDQMQIETKLDNVDARLRSLELDTGAPDTRDQRAIAARP